MRSEFLGCQTAVNHFFDRYKDKYGIDLIDPVIPEPSDLNDDFQAYPTAPTFDSSRVASDNIPATFSSKKVNNLYISVNHYPIAGMIVTWMFANHTNDTKSSRHEYTQVNSEDNDTAETVAKVAVGACALVVLVSAFFIGGLMVRDVSEALKVKRDIRKIDKTLKRQISSCQKTVAHIDKKTEKYFKDLDKYNKNNTDGFDTNNPALIEVRNRNEQQLKDDVKRKDSLNDLIRPMQSMRDVVSIHKQYHNMVLKKRVTCLATLVAAVAGVVLFAVGVIVPYTSLIVAGAVIVVASVCFGGAFFTFHIGDGRRMKAEVNETTEQAKESYNWVHDIKINKPVYL